MQASRYSPGVRSNIVFIDDLSSESLDQRQRLPVALHLGAIQKTHAEQCDLQAVAFQHHRFHRMQRDVAEPDGVERDLVRRGIGLLNKIRAYALQDQGSDTVEANHALGFAADMRDYRAGAHILFDLGAREVRLMTNNPDKVAALEKYGLKVVERVAVDIPPRDANRRYLDTKRTKFGHLLAMVSGVPEKK